MIDEEIYEKTINKYNTKDSFNKKSQKAKQYASKKHIVINIINLPAFFVLLLGCSYFYLDYKRGTTILNIHEILDVIIIPTIIAVIIIFAYYILLMIHDNNNMKSNVKKNKRFYVISFIYIPIAYAFVFSIFR